MRSLKTILVVSLLTFLLNTNAEASTRWLYVGATNSTSFYIDNYTICKTKGGDLSLYIRAHGRDGVHTDRLVINIEARTYCWPDYSGRWRGIRPDSILDDIWAVAYRVKYGN